MKAFRLHFFFIITLTLGINLKSAQESSLSGQLSSIMEESESYESYKVIKTSKLIKFKSTMLDSLFEYKQKISLLETEMAQIKADLDILKKDYTFTRSQLEASEAKNATIGFLWFQVNKESYNLVVWSFVALLLTFITILYLRIKHVCAVVKRVKTAYSKIMDEYRMQRHQSVEKQMKLKREIQTMQNRLELMQSLEDSATA